MAAKMLKSIPSCYTKISEKSFFICANTYENYIVCKDYCIALHGDKACFLPACKYHIILVGNVEELLKRLDLFCFTYQQVDCLDSLESLLQRKDNCLITCNEQLTLITETGEWIECRALQKRDSCLKSLISIYSAPSKRQKQRRPVVQCLQKDLKKSKRLYWVGFNQNCRMFFGRSW